MCIDNMSEACSLWPRFFDSVDILDETSIQHFYVLCHASISKGLTGETPIWDWLSRLDFVLVDLKFGRRISIIFGQWDDMY